MANRIQAVLVSLDAVKIDVPEKGEVRNSHLFMYDKDYMNGRDRSITQGRLDLGHNPKNEYQAIVKSVGVEAFQEEFGLELGKLTWSKNAGGEGKECFVTKLQTGYDYILTFEAGEDIVPAPRGRKKKAPEDVTAPTVDEAPASEQVEEAPEALEA